MQLITRYVLNPGRFLSLAGYVQPVCAVISLACFAYGLSLALWNSPPDYQQGETVRIMYIHVPAAWVGILLYTVMAGAAGLGIVGRLPMADIFCVAAAPVGAVLTMLCLITGSIWGKPTWGAWWVWDARLTSVLILFLLYCGYIILRQAFDDHERGSKVGAILLLVGVVNIPIIHFSVNWWHTLHQPASVLSPSGSAIAPEMLKPLLVMALAYCFYTASIVLMRMRAVIITRRVEVAALDGPNGRAK
jgi:heme exporter protein C